MTADQIQDKRIQEHQLRIERKLKDQLRRKLAWRKKHGKNIGKGGTQVARAFKVITDRYEEFDSAVKASKKFGVTKSAIHHAIQNPNRTSCDRRWAFKKDGRPSEWDQPAIIRPGSRNQEYLKSVGLV